MPADPGRDGRAVRTRERIDATHSAHDFDRMRAIDNQIFGGPERTSQLRRFAARAVQQNMSSIFRASLLTQLMPSLPTRDQQSRFQ